MFLQAIKTRLIARYPPTNAKLLDFFKQYRCLLVLDNAETILANPNEDPKLTEWVIIDQGLSHMVNYSKGW